MKIVQTIMYNMYNVS